MLHNTLKNPAGVDAPDGAKTDIYFNVQDDHKRPGRQPCRVLAAREDRANLPARPGISSTAPAGVGYNAGGWKGRS